MTLQLAYVGLAMVATGVATFYAVDRAAPFILVNLIAGALALAAAGVLALRRLRLARTLCWWIPSSCANALAPTLALLGGTVTPMICTSSRPEL